MSNGLNLDKIYVYVNNYSQEHTTIILPLLLLLLLIIGKFQAFQGSRGIAVASLNLGIRLEWVVNAMPWWEPRYPL
jgi:hypothetical protein